MVMTPNPTAEWLGSLPQGEYEETREAGVDVAAVELGTEETTYMPAELLQHIKSDVQTTTQTQESPQALDPDEALARLEVATWQAESYGENAPEELQGTINTLLSQVN